MDDGHRMPVKSKDDEWRAEELAVRAAHGDATAFGALYERFNFYVKRTALRVVHHQDDAEDVAQNVWSKLLLNLWKYKPEARFTTWLHSTVTNAAIDHARHLQRDNKTFIGAIAVDDDERNLQDREPGRSYAQHQEVDFLRRRIEEELMSALVGLRGRHEMRARCFEMHFLREMSVSEIAREIHLSEGTIKSHLYLGRKYIREKHPILSDLHFALAENLGKAR